MSKKLGKLILFSAVAGAAAYGAYHYFQTKDNAPSSDKNEDTDDDFDDFSEDLDDETVETKERSYVSLNLDKAEAIASEAFQKAKEVIADSVQQLRENVKSVTESQVVSDANFTDLTAINKEKTAQENDTATDVSKDEAPAQEAADEDYTQEKTTGEEPAASESAEKVEEFFDDEA